MKYKRLEKGLDKKQFPVRHLKEYEEKLLKLYQSDCKCFYFLLWNIQWKNK
jgi:hypothetical protein